MLVAEGVPEHRMALNHKRFGFPEPENHTATLINYFFSIRNLFGLMMDNWFDQVTGLLNRPAFERELYPSMKRWLEKGREFTILLFDLDRFKEINDKYGHAAGDKVLKAVGEKLVSTTKSSSVLRNIEIDYPDFAVRYGGDEFLVILQNIDSRRAIAPAQRLQAILSQIKHEDISVSASIGMLDSALIKKIMGETGGEFYMIEKIDELLYKSKAERGSISYLDSGGFLVRIKN